MTAEALLARQTRVRAGLRARAVAAVQRRWQTLGSWDRANVEEFVSTVVPVVQAGQMQTAAATDIFVAQLLSEMLEEPVAPLGFDRSEITDLRPAPPEEVYQRPFVEHWTALKNGEQFTEGLRIAADRLERLVEDDLSLAHRTALRRVLQDRQEAIGMRRVIRPELSESGETCGLCIAAAANIYSLRELAPIHTRCNCEFMPIMRMPDGTVKDPGGDFNGQDLDTLYRSVLPTTKSGRSKTLSRGQLAKIRFRVDQHGELGPVLTRVGDDFTGPDDVD